MSAGKSSTSGKTSQQQTQNANTSATPNNLPYLQAGWSAASDLFKNTSGGTSDLVNNGLGLVGTGANAASGAAVGGLNTATGLANGGTANGANKYLTPYADGSMSGNNPSFQALLDHFAQGAQAATDGDFAASGRYGSGANANAYNSAVANEAGNLAYQNYGDSQNRQLQAGGQLSTNNTNSTNAAMAALGLIPGLGGAATNAGGASVAAGETPAITFAQILQALGAGGGTSTTNASGTGSGTSSQSGMSFGLDLGKLFNPLSFFSAPGA